MDVAMDKETDIDFWCLLDALPTGNEDLAFAATTVDGSGKFPVHRVTVNRRANFCDFYVWVKLSNLEGVSTAYCVRSKHPILNALKARSVSLFHLEELSKANGFRG